LRKRDAKLETGWQTTAPASRFGTVFQESCRFLACDRGNKRGEKFSGHKMDNTSIDTFQ
jgi:hypothetical protein